MPQCDAYLFFDGNCAEAMRFYAKTLGAKNFMAMTAGQSPEAAKMPKETHDKVLHARFEINGRALMASDWMGPEPYEGMKGFAVSLAYPTAAEAKRIFEALGEGGKAPMPFQKTFFAEGFGMVTDRFGTPWMVSGGMQ
jgi:PhnB protein